MKNLKSLFIIVLALSVNVIFAQDFTLNASELKWTGKAAFNSYALTGTLVTEKGYVKVEENQIVEMKIIVDMKSLDHENSDLKTHLSGNDFFEVKTYSKAIFKLTQPATIIEGRATLIGNMTIKETTKEEIIDVEIDSEHLILSFSKTLDRTTYGVIFNSPSIFKKLKENAIADTFILEGELTFK